MDDDQKEWDPIRELEELLAQEGEFDVARAEEVLDGLRLDFLESVGWADRSEVQKNADRLAALLRPLSSNAITRERVVGAAAEILELCSDWLACSRPLEQDAWLLRNRAARKMFERIADYSVRKPVGYAHLVRIAAIPAGADKVRDRLEANGLIACTFGKRGYRYVALTPAGWELVPHVFRKAGRTHMPVPPDDGRFVFLTAAWPM